MSKSDGFVKQANQEKDLVYVAYATVTAKGISIGDKIRRVVEKDAGGTVVSDQYFNDSVDPITPLATA